MNENQFCGAADADESPSSDAVDAEGGLPFLGVADVADESPSCGAVDEALVCCGWCGIALTGAGVVADGTDQWESP